MSEDGLIGFAQLIYNQFVRPLEDSQRYKDEYGDKKMDIFLHMTDATHAAILRLDNGNISAEGIAQSSKDKLLKAEKECNVRVKTTMRLFAELDNMSILKILGKLIKGDMKVKGLFKLLILMKLRKLADEEDAAALEDY